jgi:hypothetical protein
MNTINQKSEIIIIIKCTRCHGQSTGSSIEPLIVQPHKRQPSAWTCASAPGPSILTTNRSAGIDVEELKRQIKVLQMEQDTMYKEVVDLH